MKFTKHFNNMSVEVEADTPVDAFTALSVVDEIFSNTVCGACGSEGAKFSVRTNDAGDFFEMKCDNTKCRAKLAFGKHKGKGGGLFPKRRSEDKQWLPNNGWVVYRPES